MELRTSSLIDSINLALDAQAPKRRVTLSKPRPKWWSDSLTKRKREINAYKKRRYANFDRLHFDNLKRQFKYEIDQAKKDSWRTFCSSANSTSDLSKLIKTITSKSSHMALIKNSEGVGPRDLGTSHQNLLSHHFPEYSSSRPPPLPDPPGALGDAGAILEYVTPTIVRNSLNSFAPNKAPGPDELRPKILQNLGPKAIEVITNIYRESLSCGEVPAALLRMKVVFLPKDKPDKSCAKSYRPITLSSFILKGLERIIQWYFQETLLSRPLFGQHAYTKNRSCDSALSEAVNFAERGLSSKNYTLMVSLDCSGAFDNLSFQSSIRALAEANAPPLITKWYHSLLSNRIVHSEINDDNKTIYPTRGSPKVVFSHHWCGSWPWTLSFASLTLAQSGS